MKALLFVLLLTVPAMTGTKKCKEDPDFYKYLSGTIGLHDKPLKIAEGKPLKLRYGVALWDRAVDSEEIDRLYQRWQSHIME